MTATLKAAARRVLAASYTCTGLPRVRHRGRVAILTYHRVVSDEMVQEQHIQPGMYVRARSFDMHLAYLREHFTVLALDRLLELWQADRLDRREAYCVITFDDGWRDNYEFAFPALKQYEIPATIFLATDYIGTSRWFWPDQVAYVLGAQSRHSTPSEVAKALTAITAEMDGIGAEEHTALRRELGSGGVVNADRIIEWCKELKQEVIREFVVRLGHELNVRLPDRRVLLDWSEIREMAAHGVTFGSHSCSHRILTHLSRSEAEQELAASWQAMLQQEIKPVPVFCYPNGDCSQALKGLVRENGYLAGVGCEVGLEGRQPNDLLALKRITMHEDGTSSPSLLAFALSGLR